MPALPRLHAVLKAATGLGYARKPQVILVHPGAAGDTLVLHREIADRVPELTIAATLVFAALPGGRYYELKNSGICQATGDIVIFSNSDTVAEPGWLPALLKLGQAGTVAVNGYTYLRHDDFASRTFALLWFFPLRDHDRRFAAKRSMNAKPTCAFRQNLARQPSVSAQQRLQGVLHAAEPPIAGGRA